MSIISEAATAKPRHVFMTCTLVMLATVTSPPLLRMFGSQIWNALGISEAQWSVLLALRGLLLILFVLLGGVVGDLFGVRRVLLLALWGYLVASFLTMAAPSMTIFTIANVSLAAIGAIIRTLNIVFLLFFFERRQRIFVLMAYSALNLIGILLSPLVAEQFGTNAGARWAYLLSVGLTAITLWLVVRYLPNISTPRASTAEILSLNVWTWGLCAIIFALVLAGIIGWTSPVVLLTLTLGAITLLGITWYEIRTLGEKWMERSRQKRQLGIAVAAGIVLNLALYSITIQIFNFMERIQNIDPLIAGIRLAPILVGAVLFGAVAAQMNIRFGARNALSLGLLVIALAATGFLILQPDLPYWVLALLLGILGFGFILGNTPRLLLLNSSVPLGLMATGQAIGGATAQLAGALAYALMLTLIQGFGLRALGDISGISVTTNQVANQMHSLAGAAGGVSTLLPSEAGLQIAEVIIPGFNQAYTKGLSQAMFVLAGICVLTAIVVQIGLSNPRKEIKIVENYDNETITL